jgi:hypothetical protein
MGSKVEACQSCKTSGALHMYSLLRMHLVVPQTHEELLQIIKGVVFATSWLV